MQKIVTILSCVLLLGACNTFSERHMEDVSDITQTRHKVTGLRIDAGNASVQNDPNYNLVYDIMYRQLVSEIQKMPPTGRPVGLVISIDELKLNTSTARTIVFGDAYSIDGTVSIVDMQTHQPLVSKEISGTGAGRAGLPGIIGDGMFTEEEKIESAISGFTDRALYFVYPERSGLPF
tara:strand:+ start:37 stop:570 length:534 start_codon:yes stop_codon:yes gene_type:complete